MQAALPLPDTSVHPPDLTYHSTVPAKLAPEHRALLNDLSFRHSGWLADRRRIFDALYALDPVSSRVERFRYCGSNAWVLRNAEDPGQYAVTSNHCHDRFCRPCAAWKARVVAHNLATHLGTRPYRFLTLTICNTNLTLTQALKKLYVSFARLRRSRLWLKCVRGGCAVCEIKPSAGGTRWHPHLHCIIEGTYLPQPVIRKIWHQITGDSYIVDIRLGSSSDSAADYVAKYITKPFDSDTIRRPNRLLEAIQALTRLRVVTTFGSWRGLRLTEYTPQGVWEKVCPLSVLIHKAQSGDAEARAILLSVSHSPTLLLFPNPEPPARPPKPEHRQWTLKQSLNS